MLYRNEKSSGNYWGISWIIYFIYSRSKSSIDPCCFSSSYICLFFFLTSLPFLFGDNLGLLYIKGEIFPSPRTTLESYIYTQWEFDHVYSHPPSCTVKLFVSKLVYREKKKKKRKSKGKLWIIQMAVVRASWLNQFGWGLPVQSRFNKGTLRVVVPSPSLPAFPLHPPSNQKHHELKKIKKNLKSK